MRYALFSLLLLTACPASPPATDTSALAEDTVSPADTSPRIDTLTDRSDTSSTDISADTEPAETTVLPAAPRPLPPTLSLRSTSAILSSKGPLIDRLFDVTGLPASGNDGMHVAFVARADLSPTRRNGAFETRVLRIVRVLDKTVLEDHLLVSEHELVPRDSETEAELVERLAPRLRNRLRTAQKALEPSEDSAFISFRAMTALPTSRRGFEGLLPEALRPPSTTPIRPEARATVTLKNSRLDIALPGFDPFESETRLELSRPDCASKAPSKRPRLDWLNPCIDGGCQADARIESVHVDPEHGLLLLSLAPTSFACVTRPEVRLEVLPMPR